MDYRKLFQVLVMGGALVGGATGCDQGKRTAEDRSRETEGTGGSGSPDAGAPDAGGTQAGGGGVKGW
ncbi:hypothetical protein [Pyxidicoccus trucidator]|uniref:hypothetical protein n=1 Tax=Pyxidicoccus trucidator TaxID=2709662 RepID=UPI0013DA1903|nr:hypothetical protein [Pyxidicoccus trucidator]